MPDWTIQKLLNWITDYFTTKKIDSPRLNAEILMTHVLGLKRIELYTNFSQLVSEKNLEILHEMVKRAGLNEPVAYLTGKTEFYSLELLVNTDTLIPRPETELLVERAIELLRTRPGKQLVCDLCTGSGCIAVAIAKNFPDAQITATDISDKALAVAAKNVEKHMLASRIRLLHGDLFAPLRSEQTPALFDIIVSNPPYVSSSQFSSLEKNVKDYEPQLALLAGNDGLDVCDKIISQAALWLKPGGALMLEIGFEQGPAIKKLMTDTTTFGEITIEKDFNNNDRVAIAHRI